MQIVVIDYGMGNLRSVSKALEHVVSASDKVIVSSDHTVIAESDRVVCPGQGAAKDCMQQLQAHGMHEAVQNSIEAGKPFLGICMGLQVLLSHSQENDGIECLGMIEGDVLRFPEALADSQSGARLKVPHMGWSKVAQNKPHPLWADIASDSRFYFCHSYYVQPVDPMLTVGTCEYGLPFSAVLAKDNVFACQFHPEKSAVDGLKLLENFSRWDGNAD